MEKAQWNSIDKKQNGLKYSKNDESSTQPIVRNNYEWEQNGNSTSGIGKLDK